MSGAGDGRLDRAPDRRVPRREEFRQAVAAELDAHAARTDAAAQVDRTEGGAELFLDRFHQSEIGRVDGDPGLDPARQAGRRRQLGEIAEAEPPASARISALPIPASTKGWRTPCSDAAFSPGRKSPRSSRLVPDRMVPSKRPAMTP